VRFYVLLDDVVVWNRGRGHVLRVGRRLREWAGHPGPPGRSPVGPVSRGSPSKRRPSCQYWRVVTAI